MILTFNNWLQAVINNSALLMGGETECAVGEHDSTSTSDDDDDVD